MTRARVVSVGLIKICILAVTTPLSGSWAQINGATRDEALQEATNQGSASFLQGVNSVHNGLSQVDAGQLEDAARSGSEALKHFEEARQHFENVLARLREDGETRAQLDEYLQKVPYDERAAIMSGGTAPTPTWNVVEEAARTGSTELFEVSTDSISFLAESASGFFAAVASRRHTPMAVSVLLRRVGGALEFGAYVSAIFAEEAFSAEVARSVENGAVAMSP